MATKEETTDIEELSFSPLEHHHSVRKDLNELVEKGEITEKEAEQKYDEWLEKRRKHNK